ncbi:hypothetical protein CVIRNUC_006049 [Coccomyxa viridis]|uniref:Uncharacterized protein n=1 Tax=Coccomyxa viridis TaxID=1274662 RepID=A0AAV1IA83_9CHLO|nr:hypothetical protein CVIRNUC_006049 [Coccomyxa viridis]
MAQGHFQKSTASQDAQLHSSTEQGPGFQVQCDVNGCIIVPVAQEEAADNFSVELTRHEYDDFIKASHRLHLLKNLRQSVATLQICGEWGAGKEEATLQMSTERVWMQGRVPQKRLTTLQNMWNRNNGTTHEAFSLQFIFTTPGQRQVEGKWDAETVMTVLQHLDSDSELLPPGITADLAEAVPA